MTENNCFACIFYKEGKCTRFEPCYKKPTELVFVGIVSETEHIAEEK